MIGSRGVWWRGSAVMQALLGFTSEHLDAMFPALPGQPGYNKAPARSPARCRPS